MDLILLRSQPLSNCSRKNLGSPAALNPSCFNVSIISFISLHVGSFILKSYKGLVLLITCSSVQNIVNVPESKTHP